MTQYIDKAALVAEIERRNVICKKVALDLRTQENKDYYQGKAEAYKEVLDILNTLEVKEANEALRTEYEKGRADVIADTLSWLENCWPQYCSNQTIIEGYKEAIKGE